MAAATAKTKIKLHIATFNNRGNGAIVTKINNEMIIIYINTPDRSTPSFQVVIILISLRNPNRSCYLLYCQLGTLDKF